MTDNDIIKALECCSDNEYYCDEDCPFFVCCSQADMAKCSLDLINRQKEEIERLKDYPYTTQIEVSKKLESQIKFEAITEFVEKSIEQVEKARQKYQGLCKEQGEGVEEAMHIHFNGMVKIIRNVKKEMVGDNND